MVTSPPSVHGHVRARHGGVAKCNNRYSADPDNLAHTGPGDLADGITQILGGCTMIARTEPPKGSSRRSIRWPPQTLRAYRPVARLPHPAITARPPARP